MSKDTGKKKATRRTDAELIADLEKQLADKRFKAQAKDRKRRDAANEQIDKLVKRIEDDQTSVEILRAEVAELNRVITIEAPSPDDADVKASGN